MSRAPPSKGTPSSLPLREYLELEMRAEMHLSKGDSKSALLLFERCLRHSESADGSANPPSARTAALLFTVGRCCFLSGDNLRAMGFLRRSAEATLGDILTRCDASLILCDAMMNCYQHSLAEIQCAVTFELLEQASAEGKLIASAAVCARRRARCHTYLGAVFGAMGQPFESLREFEAALGLFEAHNDHAGVQTTLCLMADELIQQGLFNKALETAQRALTSGSHNPSGSTEITLFRTMGRALQASRRFDEALEYTSKALDLTRQHNSARSEAEALIHREMAGVFISLKRPADALKSLHRARDILESCGLTDRAAFAEVLFSTGWVLRDHPSKALPLVERALALYRRMTTGSNHPNIATCLDLISKLKSKEGDSDAAAIATSESASIWRRSQTRCAAADCTQKMKEDGSPLEICAGCLQTYYCSIDCQRADWKAVHKAECKQLQQDSKSKSLTSAPASGAGSAKKAGGGGGGETVS